MVISNQGEDTYVDRKLANNAQSTAKVISNQGEDTYVRDFWLKTPYKKKTFSLQLTEGKKTKKQLPKKKKLSCNLLKAKQQQKSHPVDIVLKIFGYGTNRRSFNSFYPKYASIRYVPAHPSSWTCEKTLRTTAFVFNRLCLKVLMCHAKNDLSKQRCVFSSKGKVLNFCVRDTPSSVSSKRVGPHTQKKPPYILGLILWYIYIKTTSFDIVLHSYAFRRWSSLALCNHFLVNEKKKKGVKLRKVN